MPKLSANNNALDSHGRSLVFTSFVFCSLASAISMRSQHLTTFEMCRSPKWRPTQVSLSGWLPVAAPSDKVSGSSDTAAEAVKQNCDDTDKLRHAASQFENKQSASKHVLVYCCAGVFVLHLCCVYIEPLGNLFDVYYVTPREILELLAISLLVFVSMDLKKLACRVCVHLTKRAACGESIATTCHSKLDIERAK